MRMLGSGRPFVLEVADAHGKMPPQQRLEELQEQLKASGIGVEVLKLQAAPKGVLKAIKVLFQVSPCTISDVPCRPACDIVHIGQGS